MEKRILLIGNTDGLPGVKVDLLNFKKYFRSQKGGDWFENEILTLPDPSRNELMTKINQLKYLNLDFLIVIFSGHGGQKIETILEINENGDKINESELYNISKRQITILDCCRAYPQQISDGISERILNKAFSAHYSTREKYEKRILQASYQQVKIYACQKGQCSIDTSEGGVYSKNLLKVVKEDSSDFILLSRAHQLASLYVENAYPSQKPEIEIPRLLTDQQLIFGIN